MLIYCTLFSIVILSCLIFYKRYTLSKQRAQRKQQEYFETGISKQTVAFLHPHCNAGGGGEKVLMCMIEKLQKKQKHNIVVYSAEEVDDQSIIDKANTRFSTQINNQDLKFIPILNKKLLEPKKRFTLLCQIIGQMIYALKCINSFQPDIFLDSTGLPFTFFIVKILLPNVRVIAYVHYPFISTDMISQVEKKEARYNNDDEITKSERKTKFKLWYYKFLFFFYSLCGKMVEFAYVNSTWTYNHMKQTWKSTQLIKLFPPCQVDAFMKRKQFTNQFIIISFAQFRPEKQHLLQIEIVEALVDRLPSEISQSIKLFMIGSCRNADDDLLFQTIQDTINRKNLQDYITMHKNLPFQDIQKLLTSGMIGLHTMEYEHFGITLVEMLAAGLIVVAHNSAGPKLDILANDVGFLCENLEDYVLSIVRIMQLTDEDRSRYQLLGRKQAINFSDESFKDLFNI
ncbi:unnamed protein product [Paramecium pentaurelia]|uniref:GDP-Man:Man(3)GlcNAc(2)-PP-Dol alpha-1,2-mannosyltransferase n=1 Tax=Paramecium pentaurelia TaxID=43138 RepID=A0A8S1XW50_9CILI|nr:unnamed protein product [Paramecium pentaurelia]